MKTRPLFRVLFSALGLLAAAALLPGVKAQSALDALLVALLLGALNATLGAFLKVVAFVPVACSFGCLSLVINGAVFWLAGGLAHRLGLGFEVRGLWAGILGALVTSCVAWLLERIFLGPEERRERVHREGPRRVKVIDPED